VSRLFRDLRGSSLVEFTLIFPMLLLVALGTVDICFMFYDWTLANSAAYRGARAAIVSAPVASGITDPTYDGLLLGQPCFDSGTGSSNGNCPSMSSTCTAGSCTGGFAWNESAFSAIFSKMQAAFPRLTRANVEIEYQTIPLGFVGRPDGLPLNITIRIKCATHQLYFLPALANWVFSPAPGCAEGGMPILQFPTSMTSEDMVTN
jgi:TadE-like protein